MYRPVWGGKDLRLITGVVRERIHARSHGERDYPTPTGLANGRNIAARCQSRSVCTPEGVSDFTAQVTIPTLRIGALVGDVMSPVINAWRRYAVSQTRDDGGAVICCSTRAFTYVLRRLKTQGRYER
ncbi:MAG: hypothetical protein ABIN58_04305 [candidate division WOR-3 bacterium]